MRVTATHLLASDAFAHVASGVAVLADPGIWRSLGLPAAARVPVGAALVATGAWHGVSVLRSTPAPAVRVSAALNAGWTTAALVAQAFPHTVAQRSVLGSFAAWHGTMAPLKLALPRH